MHLSSSFFQQVIQLCLYEGFVNQTLLSLVLIQCTWPLLKVPMLLSNQFLIEFECIG